jgi:hypothetical protein
MGTSGENVMELRVHLKVCEGCGCLWYRVQAETGVYCSSCHQRFKDFPKAGTRDRRGRPRKAILPTLFAVEAFLEHDFTVQGSADLLEVPSRTPISVATKTSMANPALPRSSSRVAILSGGAH